jgi:hypothetical protein
MSLTTTDGPGRVVVVSFTKNPPDQVREYIDAVLAAGADVDLFVLHGEPWLEVGLDPRVRLHVPSRGEDRHPIQRAERLFVYRIPHTAISASRWLAARVGLGRALRGPIDTAERGLDRIAGIFHRRVFMVGYQLIRPHLLARMLRAPIRAAELGSVDRIVAADTASVTAGYQLARQYPDAVATTSMRLS